MGDTFINILQSTVIVIYDRVVMCAGDGLMVSGVECSGIGKQ
jgi:hypothetical protein